MATITNGLVFIIVAQLGLYFTLFKNKTRLYRLIGCVGMIAVGLTAVMVEDSAPALAFAGVSIIIAGIKLFEDIAKLTRG